MPGMGAFRNFFRHETPREKDGTLCLFPRSRCEAAGFCRLLSRPKNPAGPETPPPPVLWNQEITAKSEINYWRSIFCRQNLENAELSSRTRARFFLVDLAKHSKHWSCSIQASSNARKILRCLDLHAKYSFQRA